MAKNGLLCVDPLNSIGTCFVFTGTKNIFTITYRVAGMLILMFKSKGIFNPLYILRN